MSSSSTNCTTASAFEKPNSIRFEILFGDYQKKLPSKHSDKCFINAFDYKFTPNQIFGFAYESTGQDFQKFHHAFVLMACSPGEVGNIIPGIYPGAKILISALSKTAALRLKKILEILQKNSVILSDISISKYRNLNRLLDIKNNVDFWVGELLAK